MIFKNVDSSYARTVKAYVEEFKKQKKLSIASVIILSIGNICAFYLPPLVVSNIFKKLIKSDAVPTEFLVKQILLFSGIWLFGELIWRFGNILFSRILVKGINNLYLSAWNKLLEKEINFFHENFSGSLTKRTISYAKNFENFAVNIAHNVIAKIIPFIFGLCVLYTFSPYLSLVFMISVVIIYISISPLILRRKKLVKIREAANNEIAAHIADVYTNVDYVKAVSGEKFETEQYGKKVGNAMKKTLTSWDYIEMRIDMLVAPLLVLMNVIGISISLFIGNRSNISPAAIFVTFSYFTIVSKIIWDYNMVYRNIENSISEAAQLTELIMEDPKILDNIAEETFDSSKLKHEGKISFNNVGFEYENNITDAKTAELNGQERLFHKLNIEIKPGEKVGLVGRSGGGKTTITKLILRFIDVQSGSISIDDIDIRDMPQSVLRSQIAYVPQDPSMFHRSISENISYGSNNVTSEKIVEASKMAHADEFIKTFAQQYETFVGERGVKLSGGQRQRIAIARAILRNAPILILDEATSALDSESEVLIQEALWKLMEGKTTIVIAHRLSTISKMDRILVFDEGEIAEQGTHRSLLLKKGLYATLWKHQSGNFLEDT